MSDNSGAYFYFGESPHEEHVDKEASTLGMWLFLFTELLLFGALFIGYAVLRTQYLNDFHLAAGHLNTTIGTINTIVLLISSLSVVVAIIAVQKEHKMLCVSMMLLTILCGGIFLGIKSFEWSEKFSHDIFLQTSSSIKADPASQSPLFKGEAGDNAKRLPDGQVVFYGMYFLMTGLHALHIIIGMILLSWMTVWILKDKVNKHNYGYLENSGLYWHIVDLIWIFLFPLYYLIT